MLLHRERGLGCTLRLSMEIQPLGCCFEGCVLRLRLLVASVRGSAGRRSRWGRFLTLDLVVCCSSTSGAEVRVLASWDPLLVSSSLYSPATGKPLGFSRLWTRFSSYHCWSLLHWRHLSVFRPARVLMVACHPLLWVWRTAPSHVPLMLCASTSFLVNPGLF